MPPTVAIVCVAAHAAKPWQYCAWAAKITQCIARRSEALPSALPAGAERLPAAAGSARFPIPPKPSQIFPILSRGKQVCALRRYIVSRNKNQPPFQGFKPHTRAAVCVAAVGLVGLVGLVGQVGRALPPTVTIVCVWQAEHYPACSLRGWRVYRLQRALPASHTLPYTLILSHILSRGKQVCALRRHTVCRNTPHTRAIVCVAAERSITVNNGK